MPNHVHLVAIPSGEGSMAKAVGRTDFVYTQRYVNRAYGRCGHLWQNRFFSCPLDDKHLWAALAYVDRNPVRAGLVPHAWDYPWSSAAAHVDGADPAGLVDPARWAKMAAAMDFRKMLLRSEDEHALRLIRQTTHSGRPLGGDKFLDQLESVLGRGLRPRVVGRPKTGRKPRHRRATN
jgi:putative transposase